MGREARLEEGGKIMDYRSLLEKTAKENNSISCMGINPNFSSLPEGVGVDAYYVTLLEEIKNKGI